MQHLGEKWLKTANYIYIFLAATYVCIYVYFAFMNQSIVVNNKGWYGISFLAAAFATSCLIYNLFLFRIIKKSNLWLAYMIGAVLFILANNSAIESALNSPWGVIYLGITVVFVLNTVSLGPVVALFAVIISGIVFAMTASGTTNPTLLGVAGDGISVAIRTFGVIILLFLLRNKYISDVHKEPSNYIERYFVDNEVVKLLTDSISDAIFIIDRQGVVKSTNPGAANLLGLSQKDMLDLDHRSILKLQSLQQKNIPDAAQPVSIAITEKHPVTKELLLVTNASGERYIDINVSPIVNNKTGDLYGAVIIIRDVSKKKQEENARSEFISTASHEMRTPVAAIEGYLALALNPQVSKIDEKAKSFLEKAHASTQHLGRLFQDLLVSAKAEDGRLASHPSVIEMSSFLEQIIEDMRMVAVKRGLQLEFIAGSGESITPNDKNKTIQPLYYAFADPDRLREVITNLFDNAVKYTESGKITIGLTGNQEVVQFFIRDTGMGISPDDLPHLFQKFYRVDNTDTRTTGGTGLGLFICRKILELYRGRIWAESELGKGSTFYVNLPRLETMRAQSILQQPITSQTQTNGTTNSRQN